MFIFVVNTVSFLIAEWLGIGFSVDGFWAALFGSIVVSIVSLVLSALLIDQSEI